MRILLAIFLALLFWATSPQAQTGPEWGPKTRAPELDLDEKTGMVSRPSSGQGLQIEAVVVNPYKSANVGSQVPGIIQKFHFDEGDFVNEGQVVVELDPTRYIYMVERAEERVKALQEALKQAEEEAALKSELVTQDASTKREVLKARSEAEIARHKLYEAQKELDLAVFDLKSCKIAAPFSGHIAVRYKQPDETVDRLERAFAIVDSSKVFAVANVPEDLLNKIKIGDEAVFMHSSKQSFRGQVERIGKLIDPKSKTKRIYMVIDNSAAGLEVGMTGAIKFGS